MLEQLARIPGFMRLWHRFPMGSIPERTEYDVWDRPNYAYGIYWAAYLAKSIGLASMSAIEFGVAGGNGLLNMERIADEIGAYFGIRIEVFGFDTGKGMPEPEDYRDLPHVWRAGFWKMDQDKLKARLKRAHLVLGDVRQTVPEVLALDNLPPIGFIAFDLDYYSSTKNAFNIFSGPAETRLPRVYCYFDDIVFPPWACHNDKVGELLAIEEFNRNGARQRIAPIAGLRWMRPLPKRWNDQMYAFHDFSHPHYTDLITPDKTTERTLPLDR